MSGNNTTSLDTKWKTVATAFEVVNIIVLVITVWIFICLLIYGCKYKRWRNGPGGSSLNSGVIYVSCFVAVGLCIPRTFSSQLIYILPRLTDDEFDCETICDIGTATYALSTSAAYLFLCIRQRLIFMHPFVKERTPSWANWISGGVFVVLAGATVALTVGFLLPDSYQDTSYGCIVRWQEGDSGDYEKTVKFIALILGFVLAQTLLVFLAIYPAATVKFDKSEYNGVDIESVSDGTSKSSSEQRDEKFCCFTFVNWLKSLVQASKSISPIQLTVRRTALCSVVMVVCDIAAVTIAEFAPPNGAPMGVVRSIYNIASIINICFMIWTFGNADRIFFMFCPTIRRMKSYREKSRRMTTASASKT